MILDNPIPCLAHLSECLQNIILLKSESPSKCFVMPYVIPTSTDFSLPSQFDTFNLSRSDWTVDFDVLNARTGLSCNERYWTFVNIRDHQKWKFAPFYEMLFCPNDKLSLKRAKNFLNIKKRREASWRAVEIFIFQIQICEKYITDFLAMSHCSKRSVRDMSFCERVHKPFLVNVHYVHYN